MSIACNAISMTIVATRTARAGAFARLAPFGATEPHDDAPAALDGRGVVVSECHRPQGDRRHDAR